MQDIVGEAIKTRRFNSGSIELFDRLFVQVLIQIF